MRRLTADEEPLRDLCHALLTRPASPTPRLHSLDDHSHGLAQWLATDRTRALCQIVDLERQRSARVWAALALDDLGEDIGPWLARLFDSHTRSEWSDLPDSTLWMLAHRPEWVPFIEPRIVDLIGWYEATQAREELVRAHVGMGGAAAPRGLEVDAHAAIAVRLDGVVGERRAEHVPADALELLAVTVAVCSCRPKADTVSGGRVAGSGGGARCGPAMI